MNSLDTRRDGKEKIGDDERGIGTVRTRAEWKGNRVELIRTEKELSRKGEI